MGNEKLSNEAIFVVQKLKMSLATMIMNIPDDDLWRVISSNISAQVQAAVEKAQEEKAEE
jgi:hypothetical protein